jgi:hypothetical protein
MDKRPYRFAKTLGGPRNKFGVTAGQGDPALTREEPATFATLG